MPGAEELGSPVPPPPPPRGLGRRESRPGPGRQQRGAAGSQVTPRAAPPRPGQEDAVARGWPGSPWGAPAGVGPLPPPSPGVPRRGGGSCGAALRSVSRRFAAARFASAGRHAGRPPGLTVSSRKAACCCTGAGVTCDPLPPSLPFVPFLPGVKQGGSETHGVVTKGWQVPGQRALRTGGSAGVCSARGSRSRGGLQQRRKSRKKEKLTYR